MIHSVSSPLNSCLYVKHSIVKCGYLIEVVDGKKVEVDRIIPNCKLERGNSLFVIDMIPFVHGSFDVIVVMDWLSRHKAEIVFMRRWLGYHWQMIRGTPTRDGTEGYAYPMICGYSISEDSKQKPIEEEHLEELKEEG
nr:putative reverse transcriptase domain-containing protein [Tanacetum cinerariifolium]